MGSVPIEHGRLAVPSPVDVALTVVCIMYILPDSELVIMIMMVN